MKKIEELKAKILGLFKKKPLVMPDSASQAAPAPALPVLSAVEGSKAEGPAVTSEGTVILGQSNSPAITPEGTMILPKTAPAPEPNMPSSVIPAGFGLRFLAHWIDLNLLLILGVLPALLLKLPFTIINLVLPILYYGILHGLTGQTLGKKIIGIKLVKVGGGKVGYPQAFARALADLLNILTMCVGYLLAMFTAKKQALHDIVCKTQVGLVQPCPMWVAIVSFVAPPLAWSAMILTIGLSMFAAVAGPLLALKGAGDVIQPNINININGEPIQTQTEAPADNKEEEEFPEDETAAPAEAKPADKVPPAAPVVKAAPAPAPAAPVPAPVKVADAKPEIKKEPEVKKLETPAAKAPEMKKIEPVKETPRAMTVKSSKPAPSAKAPEASAQTQAAIEEAVSVYLTAKNSSVQNINLSIQASEKMRRAVAQASYEINGKKTSSNLLVLNFADGWGVVRALTSGERMDWDSGKIVSQ